SSACYKEDSIRVIIQKTPDKPVTAPIEYCQNTTAVALTATATGTNTLKWYTVETGGTALASAPTPSTATAGTTTYYVSQATAGTPSCESARASLVVTITAPPAAPTTAPISYCQNATAVALTATGSGTNTIQWYTGSTGGTGSTTAPTPSTAAAGTTTYYVTQSTTGTPSCESARASLVVTVTAAPAAPTVTTPVTYCQDATATALTATATGTNSLLWYTAATGGTGSSTPITPSTSTVGSATYYVSQATSGTPSCEGPRSAIVVEVTPKTVITKQTADTLLCEGTALNLLVTATGTAPLTYQWKNTAGNLSTTRGYTKASAAGTDEDTYTVTVTGACGSPASNPIKVTVNTKPVITTQPAATASDCANGSITLSVVATGKPAPTYQWKKGGTPLSGKTAATLTLSPLAVADAGDYTVDVINSCATVTSDVSVVSVTTNVVPSVSLTLSKDEVCGDGGAGSTITLTASPIGGGTAPTYVFKEAGAGTIGTTNPLVYTVPANTGSAVQNLSFTVEMTSNSGCIQAGSANPATSAALPAKVDPQVTQAQADI
ncbi:MAG TPA: immunoglobulin domain-containing protein, partial [Fibrella sp.]